MNNEKVYIISHRPTDGCMTSWSYSYYTIVNRYENIIIAQLFGHAHTVSFVFEHEAQRPNNSATEDSTKKNYTIHDIALYASAICSRVCVKTFWFSKKKKFGRWNVSQEVESLKRLRVLHEHLVKNPDWLAWFAKDTLIRIFRMNSSSIMTWWTRHVSVSRL